MFSGVMKDIADAKADIADAKVELTDAKRKLTDEEEADRNEMEIKWRREVVRGLTALLIERTAVLKNLLASQGK